MDEIKKSIVFAVDAMQEKLLRLSHDIHDNPELGMEEFKAAGWQKALLEEFGFSVESPFCGMDTAFKGVYSSGSGGRRVAFL